MQNENKITAGKICNETKHFMDNICKELQLAKKNGKIYLDVKDLHVACRTAYLAILPRNIPILSAAVALAFTCLLGGCNTGKQPVSSTTSIPVAKQPVPAPVESETHPIIREPSLIKPEAVERYVSGDSLFASIERTPCYGKCPIYKILVYKSGYVLYEGRNFVERTGKWSTRITEKQMQFITDKARETGYFNMADEYDRPITDVPSTITLVTLGQRRKSIHNRVGGPDKLHEFEKFFDSIFDTAQWTQL